MIQPGFFDLQDRLHTIDKNGDPLARINGDGQLGDVRRALEKARNKGMESTVGPKGYDVICCSNSYPAVAEQTCRMR